MTVSRGRRGGPRPDRDLGTVHREARSIRSSGWEARGGTYRPRRRGGALGGLVFLGALAAVVVGVAVVFAGPAFRDLALGMARDNPESMGIGPIADVVRGELGEKLSEPAGSDATPVPFTVQQGASVSQIANALTEEGLIAEPLVFEFLIVTQRLDGTLQSGVFTLSETMTPQQIVTRLQQAPDPPPTLTTIALREGLRIEQIVAYLQTTDLTALDVEEFYELASNPPPTLRSEFPFLATLPEGRSLEGYLGSGVFEIDPDTSAGELIRALLTDWGQNAARYIAQARAQDRDFYQVLTMASIVERETGLDEERPLVAGVYVNRLNRELNPTGLLNADPTVIYANDTMQLREMELSEWVEFVFWQLTGASSLNDFQVAEDLQGYQTYQVPGLPPGPIDSPSVASIEAALAPDTTEGYQYFVACPGQQEHRFARNLREHNRNVAACREAGG